MIVDDSDSDWEAVGTPISAESPPLLAVRPTVKFNEVVQAAHRKLRDAKAKRFLLATDPTNDAKFEQLMDDFEAAAQFGVNASLEGIAREGNGFRQDRKSRGGALKPTSSASAHSESFDRDIMLDVAPPGLPAVAKDEGEKKVSALSKYRTQNNLTSKMLTCAFLSILAVMIPIVMLGMLKIAPPADIERSALFVLLPMLLGVDGLFLSDVRREVVSILQHPVFRQKVDTRQAFRDSFQGEDEENEEEMTEGDKQFGQALQTIVGSTMLAALAMLVTLSISPWYRIFVHPLIMKVVEAGLASIWIFALSSVDWKDTSMARDITAFIERWMPVQQVVDPTNAADQPKQVLSLALKAMQLCDELVTFVLDVILKAILIALIGYMVLPTHSFGEIRNNGSYMVSSLAFMVKTPRLPLFEWAADGLLWAVDRLRPYASRFTAAFNQHADGLGNYVTGNKELWLANVKYFGMMAGDGMLWTLHSAGRIVLASTCLHAILFCLHAHQFDKSMEIQQETPIASGVPDAANLPPLHPDGLNYWSDPYFLGLLKLHDQAVSERGAAGESVMCSSQTRPYPTGKSSQEGDADSQPGIAKEVITEEAHRPEPSDAGSKGHIMQLVPWHEWVQKYIDEIVQVKEEYEFLDEYYEKIAQELRA
ncbi:hypothetical protein AC579_3105 [Pseudocercospora musae]|uniref:Uncharacterized protein n=1 Tax=Pseudocercospora musae TaxID=113226 RepID=A0A139IBW9_9PEZI|nr:hypothetical protein AC579_3105 [Pseudocercospora musae]